MSQGDPRASFDAPSTTSSTPTAGAFEAALSKIPRCARRSRAIARCARRPAAGVAGASGSAGAWCKEKLRARSGGKFLSRPLREQQGRAGRLPGMLGVSAALVVLVVLWLAYDAGCSER